MTPLDAILIAVGFAGIVIGIGIGFVVCLAMRQERQRPSHGPVLVREEGRVLDITRYRTPDRGARVDLWGD